MPFYGQYQPHPPEPLSTVSHTHNVTAKIIFPIYHGASVLKQAKLKHQCVGSAAAPMIPIVHFCFMYVDEIRTVANITGSLEAQVEMIVGFASDN